MRKRRKTREREEERETMVKKVGQEQMGDEEGESADPTGSLSSWKNKAQEPQRRVGMWRTR